MTGSTNLRAAKRQIKSTFPIGSRTRQAIAVLAVTDFPVLIIGEAGVGKRLIAEFIHAESRFCQAAFVEIQASDCTADRLRDALSTRGTVYLSEISELNNALQEIVTESYFHTSQPHHCRLLCGSNGELLDDVKARRMKEEFFHLISMVTLRIPPLRCRKTELLSIAEELLNQYSTQFDRPKPALSEDIVQFLLNHSWPGNMNELQTAIKTFVAIGDQSISLAALKATTPSAKGSGLHKPFSLKEAARAASIEVERQLISQVLFATGGNRKRAAGELGISYKALLYKLKQADNMSRPSNGDGVEI